MTCMALPAPPAPLRKHGFHPVPVPTATKMATGLYPRPVVWQGSGALRALKSRLAESVGRLGTAEEVRAHEAGEALQGLHLHRVELPIEATT